MPGFHKVEPVTVSKTRRIESSLFPNNPYPEGSIINITGIAKTGKTSYCIQEAIYHALLCNNVLYIYNESPKNRFNEIFNMHLKEMDISIDDITCIDMYDMFNVELMNAQFNAITGFIKKNLIDVIRQWLNKVDNPTLIVIDSFTKIIRTYPAQSFYSINKLCGMLWALMDELKKYPVVLLIQQKSGDREDEKTEACLGGFGISHAVDGSIVLRRVFSTKWDYHDYGIKEGTILHTIQPTEIRDGEMDTEERILLKENGWLKLGKTLYEIRKEKEVRNEDF